MLEASRLKDGSIDLASLVKPSAKAPAKAPAKMEKPWDITVKSVSIDSWAFNFKDQVPAEPVNVSIRKIKFTGENLSTVKNAKGSQSLSLAINKKGTLSEKGTVSINPLTANLRVSAKGVEITPFQPYFTDKVRIVVADGSISAGGSVSVAQNAGKFRAAYKGDVSLNSLKTFDKENAGRGPQLGLALYQRHRCRLQPRLCEDKRGSAYGLRLEACHKPGRLP